MCVCVRVCVCLTGTMPRPPPLQPVVKLAPGHVTCLEDDDFVSALDKLMSDDLQSRRVEGAKVPVMDTAVPMHLKRAGNLRPEPGAYMIMVINGLGVVQG